MTAKTKAAPARAKRAGKRKLDRPNAYDTGDLLERFGYLPIGVALADVLFVLDDASPVRAKPAALRVAEVHQEAQRLAYREGRSRTYSATFGALERALLGGFVKLTTKAHPKSGGVYTAYTITPRGVAALLAHQKAVAAWRAAHGMK